MIQSTIERYKPTSVFEIMNYCSNCGHPVEFTEIDNDHRKRHYCPNCGTIHYHNPKIVVGCIAHIGEKVLLCKRSIEPRYGMWNLPGGFLENGETVEQGALRELKEEANANIRIKRMHSLYSIPHINHIYMHFVGELVDGQYSIGEETSEVRLFGEQEIPWDELAFSSNTFALEKFFENLDKKINETFIGAFVKD